LNIVKTPVNSFMQNCESSNCPT